MVKLFYAPGTCALASHIVLEWIGKPYELEKVNPKDPSYLELNPLGQVPAMIDGDRRTVADPYAFAMTRWGNLLPKPLLGYSNLNHFYQQMKEGEGGKRTMKQQGID